MTAQEWQPGALAQAAHGYSLAHFGEDDNLLGDCVLVRDLPKVLADLLPVQADDATIERAARVLAESSGLDWRLVGDEFRESFGRHARALAAAGLLAGVRTGRSEAESEWAATDGVSIELEQWPSPSIIRATREAAEAEFVHDGDDVLVCRTITPWRVVTTARAAQGTDTEGGGTC